MQAKGILKQDPEANFEPKKDVNGEWRRLHNKELHSLYRSPNRVRMIKSRILRWALHVDRMEEGRSVFRILTGRRPLGKPGRRWEENIGVNIKEIDVNTRNWIDIAQVEIVMPKIPPLSGSNRRRISWEKSKAECPTPRCRGIGVEDYFNGCIQNLNLKASCARGLTVCKFVYPQGRVTLLSG